MDLNQLIINNLDIDVEITEFFKMENLVWKNNEKSLIKACQLLKTVELENMLPWNSFKVEKIGMVQYKKIHQYFCNFNFKLISSNNKGIEYRLKEGYAKIYFEI